MAMHWYQTQVNVGILTPTVHPGHSRRVGNFSLFNTLKQQYLIERYANFGQSVKLVKRATHLRRFWSKYILPL
jgi:hypothetical protein